MKESVFWVEYDWFLAGEYPSAPGYFRARRKLGAILKRGIDTFIDLTEEGEHGLRPYKHLLPKGVKHMRFPIADLSVPSVKQMENILLMIAVEWALNHKIYVHCYGGHGRTGTVAGCWLAENGEGINALDRLQELRQFMPGNEPSPQTREQYYMVMEWASMLEGDFNGL